MGPCSPGGGQRGCKPELLQDKGAMEKIEFMPNGSKAGSITGVKMGHPPKRPRVDLRWAAQDLEGSSCYIYQLLQANQVAQLFCQVQDRLVRWRWGSARSQIGPGQEGVIQDWLDSCMDGDRQGIIMGDGPYLMGNP
jgi:hypothetical protein